MRLALRGSLLLGLFAFASAGPEGVLVAGATGKPSAANGRYFQTDIQYNGHGCFKKEHVKLWLCMDSHNRWNVQVESMRGGAMGILVSTGVHVSSPLDAGPWMVANDAGQWGANNAVSVTSLDGSAQLVGAEDEAVPVTSEDERLRETVATILFGAFGMGLVSLALAGSMDAHIRSYFHKLLSATMTFLIALLVTQAIWDLLFQQLFPAPMPKGLGLGFPVKPGVRIVTSFALFTLSFMSLNFFGWKCQFSRSRLYVIRTLGAHICACFGIETFTTIQHEAVFQAYSQFQGPWMGSEAAQVFTAFLVAVMAWFTFAVYRSAATGARKEIFKQPPIKPWPAPSGPSMPAAAAQTRRPESCTSLWGTQAPQLLAKAPGPDFGQFVNAGEDEACVIVLGYLINQSLTFCVSGELPGMQIVYTYHSETMIRFWLIALVSFAAGILLVMLVRSKLGDGGRAGSIANRTLFLAMSWCVYRATRWATSDYLKDNHPLMAVQGAFVISVLSVALMILLDKLLDWMLGRNGSPGLRQAFARFQAADGMSLSERGMRIVMNCLGMLMALAWEVAISFSVETVVLDTDILREEAVFSKAGLSILIGLCMIYPWRRIVLPTSEMSEHHLEESIKHERLQMDRAEDFMPVSTA